MIAAYPALFPSEIADGYTLHSFCLSTKQELKLRRIKLNATHQVFTIRPSFVMPYMTGMTSDVEHALLLRYFGVPFWVLTHIFGRDDMYWHRIEQRLGKNSLVGTTVTSPDNLPRDVLADEKHSRLNGEPIYIPMVIADDCILGASIALKADEESLTAAYTPFKTEAQNIQPGYAPRTVNIDGWKATQRAWHSLFSSIRVILCFLHAFLKIRDRCKHLKEQYYDLKTRVWDAYHAPDKTLFLERLRELETWAWQHIKLENALSAILKLTEKASTYAQAYDHPTAYRTSNSLDRVMDRQDRYLYNGKYFHGHLISAEYRMRAWALCHNFKPYCPRATISRTYDSPAHKLNRKRYHDNWLQNLMVSASMGGYRT